VHNASVGSWYKADWFLRQRELRCMFREWGSPTLSLSAVLNMNPQTLQTFRSVNNVSSSYDNGKLCTKDPISVSIKFSKKFHAFFNTFLMKGEVLGKIDHFYWKSTKHMELHTTMSYCGSEMHQLSVRVILIRCCLGSRRGSHAKFQTRKPIPNYTGWLPGTKCTSAVDTANGNASALLALSSPDAGSDFLTKHVRVPSLIL